MTQTDKEDRSPDRHGRAFVRLLDVKGKKFRVYIDEDGEFIAYINKARGDTAAGNDENGRWSDESIASTSVAGLRTKLLKAMASHNASIRVPFWVYTSGQEYRYNTRHATEKIGPTFVQNFIYGVHGSNNNALVEDENGNREQWAGWGGKDPFRGDMPESVRARYIEIAIAEHKLAVEKEKIEETWKIRVEQVAKEAIEQVVGETA
jgi:hypothetical protein